MIRLAVSRRSRPWRAQLQAGARALALTAAMAAIAALAPGAARAQTEATEPSACDALNLSGPAKPPVRLARYDGALAEGAVAVTYMGHSTFLIQTPGGVDIATDFSDWLPADFLPDVATMNGAHESHYTDNPPAEIDVVLRGWSGGGGAAEHDVTFGDARIRNVTTDVMRGVTIVYPDANSIFIVEVGDLCLGHLGHLHVTPSEAQYDAIGRIDILFTPVDGGSMLSAPQMMAVADRLGAAIVIPMHAFTSDSLARFVTVFEARYAPVRADGPTRVFSRATFPERPSIIVMPEVQ